MSSYNIFADYYDRLTENVNYQVRSDYISGFFHQYDADICQVLDLACGTGSFTKYLSEQGYTVTGCDLSAEMLTLAQQKCSAADFLQCDMRHFDFKERFDACICMLDSLNHLTDPQEWQQCFESVYRSLRKGGLFIFDVNTTYKHNHLLADNSFVFDEEDFFLSWDNELTAENTVRILLDFFVYNGVNYDRYSEEFEELAISSDSIKQMLTGYFEVLGVYNDLSSQPERADSERLYFICKRK